MSQNSLDPLKLKSFGPLEISATEKHNYEADVYYFDKSTLFLDKQTDTRSQLESALWAQ